MDRDRNYFDSVAAQFEAWVNPFDLRARREWFAFQLARLSVRGEDVLDVGCGSGHFSRIVADLGGRPVPLDLSQNLLAHVQHTFPRCVRADAISLPFRDATFGLVVSSECIEHTAEPLMAIREMVRVLRPGGKLVLSTPNAIWRWSIPFAERLRLRQFRGPENWVSRRQVRTALTQSGADVLLDEGLHLLPFQFRALWRLLDWCNHCSRGLRRWMINQCWVAERRR